MKEGDDVSAVYSPLVIETVDQFGQKVPGLFNTLDRELDAAMRRSAIVEHSYAGRIKVSGKDSLDFLHRLSTNDLLKLRPGSARGTVFTNEKGRIIDFVTVSLKENEIILLTSPGQQGTLISWLSKYHITEQVEFEDISLSTSMCSIIGPHAFHSMQSILKSELNPGRVYDVRSRLGAFTAICPEENPIQILHVFGPPASVAALWRAALQTQPDTVSPIGYFAFEAYRISRGIPSVTGELSLEYNPLEVGLRDAVSFAKGCYIGQEVIARLDTYQKVRRRLIGLAVPGPVRRGSGDRDLMKGGRVIGRVTSLMDRPVNNRFLGLAVVESSSVREGDSLQIQTGDRPLTAIALSIPMHVGGGSHA